MDFDKLKAVLGEHGAMTEPGQERYGLDWPGKRDALRAVQAPSYGTLIPAPEESVDWENTQNVFIEGDNLEVLKLLQKSYYGKVKMIYIDPPYNTGNDFVYPDNYAESLETYLKYTGKIDDQGFKTTTNSKDSGRFHSNWLRMMYPRLYVAKNLLREDGVIFISIDDNEVSNLRHICNQIFGEENFLGNVSILSNPRGRQSEKIATCHESLLIFGKSAESAGLKGEPLSPKEIEEYKYVDKSGLRYRLLGLRHRGNSSFREDRPKMYFPFYVDPKTGDIGLEKDSRFTVEIFPRKSTGQDGRWEWGKKTAAERIDLLEAQPVGPEGRWDVFHRDYLESADGDTHHKKWKSIWSENAINYQNAKGELKSLFDSKALMDYPKPIYLLKKSIAGVASGDDIVMDFFAGSATTAHALMALNAEDGGNRRSVSVQLPEPCDESSEAFKAGFKTIAGIAKERISRAGSKIRGEWEEKNAAREAAKARSEEKKAGDLFSESASSAASSSTNPQSPIPNLPSSSPPDTGFRVFKLAPSNFRRWDGEAAAVSKEALEQQMEASLDHIATGATEESILFEILLKAGYQLTRPMEKLSLAGHTVYAIDGNSLFICVADRINGALIDAVAEKHPVQFICLDRALQGNDPLKVNTLETFRAAQPEIQFRTV